MAETPLIGAELIADFVTRLPSKPGVYRMFDDKGEALYVGKARNLKNRVSNYARGQGHNYRIALMISLTRHMEFVVTGSEAEALLLEANFIKKLKPKFNVLLRDDKSFPYILIAKDHDFAQITKHRGARSRKGSYYGPFASAGAVNNALNTLQKAFLLRSCNDSVYSNRTRPCLLHQIKRCSAPCVGLIAKPEYDALVGEAEGFLTGKSNEVKAILARDMEAASEAMNFEDAGRLRDRIRALSFVTASQDINPEGMDEADVFGLAQEGGQFCVQVFFIRSGQNWGGRAYFPKADKTIEVPELLESFITQFYDDKQVPKQLLLSDDVAERELLEEAFTAQSGRKVEILIPQRGTKKSLVEHAATNAREAVGRKMAETSSQAKLLEGVTRVFDLASVPTRIEVYDNSHIQGAHAVGAMIVAGPDGFIKGQYRKFNMDSEGLKGDDFAMMREMLTRRFTRLLKEHGDEQDSETSINWPGLVLIDGGLGQLSAARGVMDDLGLHDMPIAGVAKGPDRDAGREHFYMVGRNSFMLEARDPVLYYIQRLRDEAHRFAIGSHRARRTRAIALSPLEEIAGIGPRRKKALLTAFGSAKAVARANVVDLESVEGVNEVLAQLIFDHFHQGN
jgi:excinuclease ABC subunit C